MPIPRTSKTEALVLRTRDLGEADRLLVLLTPARGKLRAVVRGARKPKSKLGGHLEPFTHVSVELVQGKNLAIVTGAQVLHSFLPVKEDLVRLGQASYVCELTDCFAPEGEENRPLFDLVVSSLSSLAEGGETVLRCFEVRLLGIMGYGPEMRVCSSCRATLTSPGAFSPSLGGGLCPACALVEPGAFRVSPAAFQTLRYLQTAAPASVLSARVDAHVLRELGQVLGGYTRYILEEKPRSATFLENLDNLIGPLQPHGIDL
jgi:DNA repair protein RecO (recombination protein O)